MPRVGICVDRRAMESYAEAVGDKCIASFICLFCAQRFTYIEEESECEPKINLYAVFSKFLTAQQLESAMGKITYLARYGAHLSDGARARLAAEITSDSQLTVLLLCPDDRTWGPNMRRGGGE